MPSSISNSEFSRDEDFARRRAPGKNWPAVWIGSVLVALALLGSAEAFWRSRGHRPTVVDDPALWAYHRSRVGKGGPSEVVVLGSSRVQLAFAMQTFRERFPEIPVAQLAVDGRAPVAALRDLASDEQFQGTVLCDITAPEFLRRAWDDQQEYIEYYHQHGWPWQTFETRAGLSLQQHAVIVSPQVRLVNVLHDILADGAPPAPIYLITRADRSRLADYTLTDLDERRTKRRRPAARVPVVEVDEWLADVAEVERLVAKIHARGGQVVFLRMPVSDAVFANDERDYPRQQYWDQMAARTAAETIHFRDVPEMRGLPVPDGSHLDYRDAPAFTQALLDELVRRGLLDGH